MNRAERRRQSREEQSPQHTYNLNNDQVTQMTREAISQDIAQMRREVLNYATQRAVAVFLVALHDEFGFGPKRLQQLLVRANNIFDCIEDTEKTEATLEDMIQLCREWGINIE